MNGSYWLLLFKRSIGSGISHFPATEMQLNETNTTLDVSEVRWAG